MHLRDRGVGEPVTVCLGPGRAVKRLGLGRDASGNVEVRLLLGAVVARVDVVVIGEDS
jgi:hypothetical protein